MARIRSYTSTANRGKGLEVFVNNYIASNEKKRKEREKEEIQKRKKEENERGKERAALLKKTAENKKRAEKDRERLYQRNKKADEAKLKERIKENEKFSKYLARTRIECEKSSIDTICAESIVQEAYASGVTLSQVKSVLIKGREDYWNQHAEELLEDQYIRELHDACLRFVKEGRILERLTEDLLSDITEERPKFELIEESVTIKKYLDTTERIKNQIMSRLSTHLETNLYE